MSVAKKITFEKTFAHIFEHKQDLLIFYKIAQRWQDFVSQTFITNTYPLKLLKNNKEENVLFVAIQNSSVGSQFYYSKEDIISKIHLYLGHMVISDIQTILRPSDKWNLHKNISVMANIKNFSTNKIKVVDLEENLSRLLTNIRESVEF